MNRGALVGACLVVACGSRAATAPQGPVGAGAGSATGGIQDGDVGADGDGDGDKPIDEAVRIAAIEHVMNQLGPVVPMCWAAGAADDLRLAGDVRLTVNLDRARPPVPTVDVQADSTNDAVLLACLREVIQAMPWPNELRGETIDLPFRFDAPAAQYVIDRRLIASARQRDATVRVLLDRANTGLAAASMIEVALPAGAQAPLQQVDRLELWYVVAGEGTVAGARGAPQALRAGDAFWLGVGGYRTLRATQDLHALLVIAPGGREGVVRAGVLPGTTVFEPPSSRVASVGPVVTSAAQAAAVPQTVAGRTVRALIAPSSGGPPGAAMNLIEVTSDLASHRHPEASELVYVMAGEGEVTVDGARLPIGADTVMQLPPTVAHAVSVRSPLRAVQVIVPAAPAQANGRGTP